MTYDPTTSPFGIEWLCVPDGNPYDEGDGILPPPVPPENQFGSNHPLFWPEHYIGDDFSRPIPGLRLQARYYVQNEQPGAIVGDPSTFSRTYPGFTVHSFTITPANRPRFFETDIGNETLVDEDRDIAANAYATTGINNTRPEGDVIYSWVHVFDRTVFYYIPRLTKPDYSNGPGVPMEPEVEATAWFPREPYDTESEPPEYPMDAVTQFKPDERERVVLEYTAVIDYTPNIGGGRQTATITLNHTVRQNVYNWGQLLANELQKTYYGQGYYPETGRDGKQPIYES